MSPDPDAAEPLIIEAFNFRHFRTQHSLAIWSMKVFCLFYQLQNDILPFIYIYIIKMNTAFITKCRCLIQVLYCRLFSQLKFSCGWWILIGQKTKRSKERYKSWEISDVTDITMKQISMGNVNFWISPEKAVSKVRQLLHLECQSSLRLILVVNMSNVNTRNRKPCRVSLDLLKLIIWEATIHSPSRPN